MARICYFGTYRDYYSRNRIMIQALRSAGMEVIECHRPLLASTFNGTGTLFGFKGIMKAALAACAAYAALILEYIRLPSHGVIMAGYIGHWDIPIAKTLALLLRRKLVFDAFVSIYDTVVNDRRLLGQKSWKARFLFGAERIVYRLCDLVIMDTNEHAKYVADSFSLRPDKIAAIPLGVEEEIYFPRNILRQETIFSVLHYSYYAPLHGARYVVDAAATLKKRSEIRFIMIGDGQERPEIEAMALQRGLTSISFLPLMPPADLADHIAEADLCLGIFGLSGKVERVIPNKILQAMAMKRPVLTAQSLAVSRYFSHNDHILFCVAGDGEAIAESILMIKDNASLREHIAENGSQRFRESFSSEVIAKRFLDALRAQGTT